MDGSREIWRDRERKRGEEERQREMNNDRKK